jgi:hypothetical protein
MTKITLDTLLDLAKGFDSWEQVVTVDGHSFERETPLGRLRSTARRTECVPKPPENGTPAERPYTHEVYTLELLQDGAMTRYAHHAVILYDEYPARDRRVRQRLESWDQNKPVNDLYHYIESAILKKKMS